MTDNPVPGLDLSDLLGQAMKVQERLAAAQQHAQQQMVEGAAGGGIVRIRASGAGVFESVHIDPRAVDPGDVAMLEDLVLAALHDVAAQVAALSQQALGGLDLGGLGNLGGLLG